MMKMMRVKVFTDRYPFLGPVIWMLTIQYFAVQLIVASAWHIPSYSWRFNTISDLGNTVCGSLINGRFACSPLHTLMNASFICLGILMASGSLLIYQEFREDIGTLVGFSLMALGGLGTILVGLFPENTVSSLHIVGAGLPFVLGNISLIVLSLALYKRISLSRIYTFMSGLIPLIALVLYINHNYLWLGLGGMERLVAYPQTVWLIFFGIYMSRNHYLQPKSLRRRYLNKNLE
jgi:hypothetical membrane protein